MHPGLFIASFHTFGACPIYYLNLTLYSDGVLHVFYVPALEGV